VLIISCPNNTLYWQILRGMDAIGTGLMQISRNARIRLYRPLDKGIPLEVRADEFLS
jgi:hypothetical protein